MVLMIIYPDRFVMANPTKTGTVSYMNLAKRVPEMKYILPKHGAVVPDEYRHLDRIMTVRNPYDRLVSIYLWLHRRPYEWRDISGLSFPRFVEWLSLQLWEVLERYSIRSVNPGGVPFKWVLSQDELFDVFTQGSRKRYYLRLEDPNRLEWLKERYGIEVDGDLRVLNVSKNRKEVKHYYKSEAVLDLVNSVWAYRDCSAFGYEVMP
jgi:hypothetical protein